MSRYESGVHEPPYQFVEAIAHVLGIQPAFFYCSDDRLADIILIYGALPEDERQALHGSAIERSAAQRAATSPHCQLLISSR